jgi:hypothetical protein
MRLHLTPQRGGPPLIVSRRGDLLILSHSWVLSFHHLSPGESGLQGESGHPHVQTLGRTMSGQPVAHLVRPYGPDDPPERALNHEIEACEGLVIDDSRSPAKFSDADRLLRL